MQLARTVGRAMVALALCSTAACQRAPEPVASEQAASTAAAPINATVDAAPGPVPVARTAEPLSCKAEIGATAADARVKLCRNVSPATHPPCNAANSCAMIEGEIARSCTLFDGEGDPMPGCTPAPKSAEAAADVVRRYYSALNARDYDTAWLQWGENGQPGQTFDRFKAGFAKTAAVRVTIGTLSPGDAGAGSVYQPVPVTIDATLANGTRQHFTGEYILRRVNDVDGATAAQRRWHIVSAKLKLERARP
ncbi:hypothetical protein [Sphingomonas sp. ID0503]|uniref:hypothetical protein n=1 Tax=Sphingomonas sp. ID0503 TaxID=3399691 RepID=UPI003AFA6B24